MLQKNYIFVLILAFAISTAYSQKEYYNWYFGNRAGISFNTSDKSPEPLYGSAMNTLEGCSAISDSLGSLLFYTDGVKVWNRLHAVMPEGTGLNGSNTSTQAALIVRKPLSDSIYYIFTTYGDYGGDDSQLIFSYSIVDMHLYGANGGVVSKNNELFSPCVEKVAAVTHRNGRDIWIIGHEWRSNKFRKFLLSPNGIKEYAAQSIGSYHGYQEDDMIGYMKFSRDSKKLALAQFGSGILELFLFDNKSGLLSSPIEISSIINPKAYGIEFSPDCSKLYLSSVSAGSIGCLYQFNIALHDKQKISESKKIIHQESPGLLGALQAGPDGKIYMAFYGAGYVSVINNPNNTGAACGFMKNSLKLYGSVQYGLPNCMNYSYGQRLSIQGGDVCKGDTIRLYGGFTDGTDGELYEWTGPAGFSSNTAEPEIPGADEDMAGWYYLSVILDGIEFIDSVFIKVNTVNPEIEPDGPLENCEGKPITLLGGPLGKGYKYKWSTGDTTLAIIAEKSGVYTLTVENSFGCIDSVSVECRINVPPDAGIIGDSAFCEGEPIVIISDKEYMYYDWSTGETSREIEIDKPGLYYLLVIDSSGCRDTAFIDIKMYPKPKVKILGDSLFCLGESVTLSSDGDFASYKWSTGDTTKDIIINDAGEYILTATNADGCIAADTLLVNTADPKDIGIDLNELGFGYVIVGEKLEKNIQISNKGAYDFEIEIYLKDGGSSLAIKSLQGKLALPAGGKIQAFIEFSPEDIIDYLDTLIIHTEEPCDRVYYIPVNGGGAVIMEVKVPEISAINGKEKCIPVFAKLITDRALLTVSDYEAEIEMDADIFSPYGPGAVSGSFRKFRLEGLGVDVGTNEKKIGEICGIAVLGSRNQSPVRFNYFNWDDKHIIIDTVNGSFSTNYFCQSPYSHINLFYSSSMTINAGLSDVSIRVASGESGGFELNIYSILGAKVKTYSWSSGSSFEKELIINTDEIGSGLYYASLKTPGSTIDKIFIINK